MNWQELNPAYLAALIGVVVAIVLVVIWRWLRRGKRLTQRVAPDFLIDVSQLDATGPSADGARLEFYGTPVRLAVVVVAPGDAAANSLRRMCCPG